MAGQSHLRRVEVLAVVDRGRTAAVPCDDAVGEAETAAEAYDRAAAARDGVVRHDEAAQVDAADRNDRAAVADVGHRRGRAARRGDRLWRVAASRRDLPYAADAAADRLHPARRHTRCQSLPGPGPVGRCLNRCETCVVSRVGGCAEVECWQGCEVERGQSLLNVTRGSLSPPNFFRFLLDEPRRSRTCGHIKT